MPTSVIRVGLFLMFMSGCGGAWAQSPERVYPFVSSIPDLPRGRGTYVSIGNEIVDVFAAEEAPIERNNQIVALRREFVSCFSREFQTILADSGDGPQSIPPLGTTTTLLATLQSLAKQTWISGWGYVSNEETLDLLDKISILRTDLSVESEKARALFSPCWEYFIYKFLELTPNRKIDPSIELDTDLLVTRFPGFEPFHERVSPTTGAKIWNLAERDGVRAIERFPVFSMREMKGNHGSTSVKAGICEPSLEKVTFKGQGESQIAGIVDTLIDTNHCAFADSGPPGTSLPKFLLGSSSPETNLPNEGRFHGTMVASLLAGDPRDNSPTKRGVARKARISFRPLTLLEPNAIEKALGEELDDDARVFSMSWGDDDCPVDERGDRKSCRLGPLTRAFDNFSSVHEDALMIAAVSNGERLAMPENGRNVLAVAAAGGTGRECVRFLGATGPSVTGQWKPDLLSRGCRVQAAIPGSVCEGDFAAPALDRAHGMPVDVDCATSWAAPALAGTALILRQFLVEGCYRARGCRRPDEADVCTPSAALLKSLLVGAGTLSEGVCPGPSTGWGLPDLARVARPQEPIFLVDVENRPADPNDYQYLLTEGAWAGPYEVALSPNSCETRVTLAWTEAAYGPNVAVKIPTDLDLFVEAYAGHKFLGVYTGDDPYSINPVERISLPNSLKADFLKIYVRAYTVVADTVLTGYQGYALSVAGALAPIVPRTGRYMRCETADPKKPTMDPPNLPLKFLPAPPSPCGSRAPEPMH